MKKICALPVLLLFVSITAMAQRRVMKKEGWVPAPEAGYSQQGGQERVELNVYMLFMNEIQQKDSAYSRQAGCLGVGAFAGLIGSINKNNTFRVGQQLGFAVAYMNHYHDFSYGFKAGISLENYTKKDQRISFSGGPVIMGFIHCQYGYNIPLGKENIPGIGRHRLGAFIYFDEHTGRSRCVR